ncbi:hypothetical protein O6H91_21G049000 [Diphasiastrum complanatum]|uniref:Uncharacterized protein n=1 Tax=Diphasiastrum complanatum TaxID=34168 RepID=A0ACC2AM27_DIPCM|nr:hypothetical protein O6H91_21G049000 [Diphasiastrum complanatum]
MASSSSVLLLQMDFSAGSSALSSSMRGASLPIQRVAAAAPRTVRMGSLKVRAESEASTTPAVVLNPSIKKDVDKVVDTVLVSDLSKPLTAYCRCWRSGTFPLCDGSHAKHNKATGDNVGPLLVKK